MDVLVVSPRGRETVPHPRHAALDTHVTALAAAGHRVRWLRPRGSSALWIEGVEIAETGAEVPAFLDVEGRFYDVPLERRLSEWLREAPAEVVHVEGFGGVSSYLTTWLSNRLGSGCLVVAAPLVDLLCHRGTLIDETGSPCHRWDDPARCLACCSTTHGGLPSPALLRRARWTRRLGPLASPPRHADFENRIDMWVHGLDASDLVVVEDEVARDALERALLPMRGVVVGVPAPGDLAAWDPLYQRAMAGRSID